MAARDFIVLVIVLVISCMSSCESKTWKFYFSLDGFPANFINSTTGELEGQSVDMVKKVCELADKDCELGSIERARCWDDSKLESEVLENNEAAVCANLVESPDRNQKYRFAEQNIYRIPNPTLIKSPQSNITLETLKECNDVTLVFPALTALNRDCLLKAGMFVKEENTEPVTATGSIVAAISTIADRVLDDTNKVGLVIPRLLFRNDVTTIGDSPCLSTLIGLNMMVNQKPDKNADKFLRWWDKTLTKFICSKDDEYTNFCQEMRSKYRDTDPLCFTPGKDVSCPGQKVPETDDDGTVIDPCA